MKVIISLILLGSFNLFSQERSIEDQIEVTRSMIKRITLDVTKQNRGNALDVPDFDAWEKAFKLEVEEKLLRFEEGFEDRVMGILERTLKKYEAISTDENMLTEQKDMLLNSLTQTIENLESLAQEEYNKIVSELYDFSDYLPVSYKYEGVSQNTKQQASEVKLTSVFNDGSKSETFSIPFKKVVLSECDLVGRITGTISVFVKPTDLERWSILQTPPKQNCISEELFNREKESLKLAAVHVSGDYDAVFKNIIKGCGTKACVVLKKATILHFVNLVSSELDKSFSVTLNESTSREKVISFKSFDKPTSYIFKNVLTRKDYSDYVNNLPFDLN